MAAGSVAGGILWLLDLIEEHRAAFRYDWRTRFGKGLDSMPDEIGWDEAVDHARTLRADMSSHLAAAVEGWQYPITHSEVILMDLYDAQRWAAGDKKWKGYPRPWVTDGREQLKRGDAAGRTPEQVKAILREQFGQPETA